MGQAKDRGPRDLRVAAAKNNANSQKPPLVRCNSCQAEIVELDLMETGSLKGIDVAFKGHCKACDLDTWAVRGETAAVRAFYAALEKSTGSSVQLGTAKPGIAH